MSHVIRIPSEIYSRLEQHAKGFDTPANVIEKLLNYYEGVSEKKSTQHIEKKANYRDTTKYKFNDSLYGKGRLVLAVIKQYVSDNPDLTYDDLQSAFPKKLQGSIGVFNKLSYVISRYGDKNHKRHFIKDDEVIGLSDCHIAVSTEWGAGNINNFIEQAKAHGYSIQPANG